MNKRKNFFGGLWLFIIISFVAVACVDDEPKERGLVIYSPHPIEFIDPIIAEFEKETGILVEIVRNGTGELISKIQHEQEEENYIGDVLWGGSIATLMNKKEVLFEPYQSQNEAFLRFKNTDGYMTRFSLMPSVIMVNSHLVGPGEIQGYQDLLKPEYKGEIAFANPELSASSYEQLLNQLWAMGDMEPDAGWDYVKALIDQLDGQLQSRSQDVYNGVTEGKYKIGLTFEEPAAKFKDNGAPVELIYPIEGTIVRPDSVAIIKHSDKVDEARQFIDFVTSYEIQELIATELSRRPVRQDVEASATLLDFDAMIVINDDLDWSASQKETLVNRFQSLYEETLSSKEQ